MTRPTLAVVIGGSMAGLVAARVLADHVDQVIVVERDRFPASDAPRKGVPQGAHIHVLLARGRDHLEAWFPGLQDELLAAGAVSMNFTADLLNLSPMGWSKQFTSSLIVPACTRPLLESRVRARVATNPRVRFMEGCDAVGLLAGPAGAVKGVRFRRRGEAETAPPEEELVADLVIDASGRAARTAPWLKELGYPAPQETVVNGFVGYATAMYQPPADFKATWKGLYIQAAPPTHLRGAVIWPVEGGRWHVTLAGMGRDYPPTDEAEFERYAQNLRTPVVYDALRQARRLTPITGYRATENRLRHYERMRAWPAGFVVLGDAACAFNPVYGQGMTVAAMSAQILDACLKEGQASGYSSQWGGTFQKRLARSNADVWRLATGADLRSPATEGDKPGLVDRLMYNYLDRVFLRATVDADVALTVAEVLHLRLPTSALMQPRILLPTLRGVPSA